MDREALGELLADAKEQDRLFRLRNRHSGEALDAMHDILQRQIKILSALIAEGE